MFSSLLVLTLARFSAVYPLFLWIVPLGRVKSRFYRFNLTLSVILMATATLVLTMGEVGGDSTVTVQVLGTMTIVVLGLLWNRPITGKVALTPLLLIWGGFVFRSVLLVQPGEDSWPHWIGFLFGGLPLASVVFAMILGHWYLNVSNLHIKYLQRMTRMIIVVLAGYTIWVMLALSSSSITLVDRLTPAYKLLLSNEELFFWIAIGFGIVVPLVLSGMVHMTARIQSTQSATGLLYITVISLLIGTTILGYYSLRTGLPI